MGRSVQFGCPGCGQSIQAPSGRSGQPVACPACGQEMIIPGPAPVPRRARAAARIAAALLLVTGAYAISPRLALRALADAVTAGDTGKIAAAIDFPALRESLKAQVTARLVMSMAEDPKMAGNPFAGLAAVAAPKLIEGAIDSYISPGAIAAMAPARRGAGGPGERFDPGVLNPRFTGPATYEFEIGDNRAIMRPRGLRWKVVDLRLGDAGAESLASAAGQDPAPPGPESPGGWRLRRDSSHMDDTQTLVLSRRSRPTPRGPCRPHMDDIDALVLSRPAARRDGGGPFGGTSALVVRIQEGDLEIYIDCDEYLGSVGDIPVQLRWDKDPPTDDVWSPSTDGTAIFARGDPAGWLERLAARESLTVRVTPRGQGPLTLLFDLRGFRDAAKPILDAAAAR